MKGYGQFCPVAKATEVLGERWTPLIIRELMCDPQSFNSLRNGVPLMSPSLLSSRLKTLEAAGIVSRDKTDRGIYYSLTSAGEEIRPIIMQLGVWGQRWARSDPSLEKVDPGILMWELHRCIDTTYFGDKRRVLRFEFCDSPAKKRLWWLKIQQPDVDICLKDPGHEVDLYIRCSLSTMTGIWLGDLTVAHAKRRGLLEVSGNSQLTRKMGAWLKCSALSHIEPATK